MLKATALAGFGGRRARSQEGVILWDTAGFIHVPVWTSDGGVLIARAARISAYDTNWNHLWTDSIVVWPTSMLVVGSDLYVVAAWFNDTTYETTLAKFAIGATGLTLTWQKKIQWSTVIHTAPFDLPMVADGTYVYVAMYATEDKAYAMVARFAQSDGAFGWAYYYQHSNYPGFRINGLALAPDGKIIVSGTDLYGDGMGNPTYMLFALNSSGVRQWHRSGIGGGSIAVAGDSAIYDGLCGTAGAVGNGGAVGKLTSDASSVSWAKKVDTTYGAGVVAGFDSSGALVLASGFPMARISTAGTVQGYGNWSVSGLSSLPVIKNDRVLFAGRSGSTKLTYCMPAMVPAKAGTYTPNGISMAYGPYSNSESAITPSIGSTEPAGKGTQVLTVTAGSVAVVSASSPYAGGVFRL